MGPLWTPGLVCGIMPAPLSVPIIRPGFCIVADAQSCDGISSKVRRGPANLHAPSAQAGHLEIPFPVSNSESFRGDGRKSTADDSAGQVAVREHVGIPTSGGM